MGTLNPWLKEQLERVGSPKLISLIIEFPQGAEEDTIRQLQEIPGVSMGNTAFNMIRIRAPLEAIPHLEAIPEVIIHYDAPVSAVAAPRIKDDLLGEVGLSSVTIPFSPQEIPTRIASLALRGILSRQFQDPSVIIVPMSEARKHLCLPENSFIEKTKVAVLDTGLTLPHPAFGLSAGLIKLGTTIAPWPYDGLGHGQWCVTAAFGGEARTRFGDHHGVAEARAGRLGSWKVLSDIGFGTSFSVIQGMEQAVKWGAKVISMSLGGELQGSVDDDPQCRIIQSLKDQVLFVIAAGNDGGKGSWTIGSPGAAPAAVTVGAYSPVYCGVSTFSSRGPNGPFYKTHPPVWSRDLQKYQNDLFKPDVIAPGGGPSKEGQQTDLILSGVVGWTQPMFVVLPDFWGSMRGTSMSCPLAAGVIALALEHGLIHSAADVKKKMARFGGKDINSGYGAITYEKLI